MAGKRGGTRARPGRPRKQVKPQPYTAQAFLEAVVRGDEPAEPNQRIAAARSLLRYEAPIKRMPPPMKSAKEMERVSGMADESRRLKEFEAKAAKTRAEHYAQHPKTNGRG
jgi:hypothetical protein